MPPVRGGRVMKRPTEEGGRSRIVVDAEHQLVVGVSMRVPRPTIWIKLMGDLRYLKKTMFRTTGTSTPVLSRSTVVATKWLRDGLQVGQLVVAAGRRSASEGVRSSRSRPFFARTRPRIGCSSRRDRRRHDCRGRRK